MVGGRHRLRAGLDPLDRAAKALGQRQHQRLLRIDLELRPEPAADVRRDHAQPVFGHVEHPREEESRDVGYLRGGVERHAAAAGVGQRSARLDRPAGRAVVDKPVLHDHVRFG